MKNTFGLLFLFALNGSTILHAQKRISFDLLFGSYTDDHHARQFYSQERHWTLKENVLTYSIDAHSKRYVDTLLLSSESLEKIENLILQDSLLQTVDLHLKIDHLPKHAHNEMVKGYIQWGTEPYAIDLRTNGYSIHSQIPEGKRIKQLEFLLHEIVDEKK